MVLFMAEVGKQNKSKYVYCKNCIHWERFKYDCYHPDNTRLTRNVVSGKRTIQTKLPYAHSDWNRNCDCPRFEQKSRKWYDLWLK